MVSELVASIVPKAIPWLKFLLYAFVIVIIMVIGFFIMLERRKRKWKIEIHELKRDGKLHTVGYDVLKEKKLNMGTKTVYWMSKARCEAIPPPDECVDRFKGKEEVDYLRVERDFIPAIKTLTSKTNEKPIDYTNPEIRRKLTQTHDGIIGKIRGIKTTFFNSEPVRSQFIYIPINKTLTANMTFKPIDYDMNMMAANQIHLADEMFASKYEFWKKYGAVIVFAVTVVFLIIVTFMTYNYLVDVVKAMMSEVHNNTNILSSLVDKIAGTKPPS